MTKKLNDPDLVNGLLSDTMRVLKKRNIYLNLSSENIIQWVNDVMDQNNIEKLLFIWDEFSTYIDQNRGQLKTFEEIAEASQQGRFFFMPVTHQRLEAYVAIGSESARKARDRFQFCYLDMPTNTAIQLAADAFEYTQPEEWEKERDVLWHSISGVVSNFIALKDQESADISKAQQSFKEILPIHPMTAFLLKFLSTEVGSNQRSMFDFLKGKTGESEFQDFIVQGGPTIREKQYLTVDYLWHYFIVRQDLGTAREVNDVRIQYENKSQNLNDKEKRIFKAVLLYSLLGRLTCNNGHELIQPTVENIVRCFEGDASIIGVEDCVKALETKHCFSIINGRCEMFRAVDDSEDLEKQKEIIRQQFHSQICQIVTQPRLEKTVRTFKNKHHYVVRCSSIDKVNETMNSKKDMFLNGDNKILLHFIIAKDAQDQLQISETAKTLANRMREHRMLFIEIPELSFCSANAKNWEDYIDQLAHKNISQDKAAKNVYERQLDNMNEEWLGKVAFHNQKLTIYKPNPNGECYIENRTWETLEEYLKKYIKEKFENFVYDLTNNNNALSENGTALKKWAKTGMNLSSAEGQFRNGARKLLDDGVQNTPEWFNSNPNHPLSKLYKFCDSKLTNALKGPLESCSIRKIYIDLKRDPYGFVNVPFSALVLGFVLKEWTSESKQLQWTDGINSDKLDEETLAEIIEAVVKDDGLNQIKGEKTICRISREEREFIKQSPAIFGIEQKKGTTVEVTLNEISSRLEKISNRTPLWVLPYYIQKNDDPQAEKLTEILDHLCEAQKISAKGNQQVRRNHIKSIGKILKETAGLDVLLNSYINAEKFNDAFKLYVDDNRPSLKKIAEEVSDRCGVYYTLLKERFTDTASWLWNKKNVEEEFEVIEAKYHFVKNLQSFIDQHAFIHYEDAKNRLEKACYVENKISIEFLAGNIPQLSQLTSKLNNTDIADGIKELTDYIENNKDIIKDFFFQSAGLTKQVEILRNLFNEELAIISDDELVKIYQSDSISSGARRNEVDFKNTVKTEIQAYLNKSTMTQLVNMWKEKNGGYETINDWAAAHNMPITMLFDSDITAEKIIPVLTDPSSFQANRIQAVKSLLQDIVFTEENELNDNFIKRFLPKKYQSKKWNIDVNKICQYYNDNISSNPNDWNKDSHKLEEITDKFFAEQYKEQYQSQASKRLDTLSDKEMRKLLMRLIEQNPEVGLLIIDME